MRLKIVITLLMLFLLTAVTSIVAGGLTSLAPHISWGAPADDNAVRLLASTAVWLAVVSLGIMIAARQRRKR